VPIRETTVPKAYSTVVGGWRRKITGRQQDLKVYRTGRGRKDMGMGTHTCERGQAIDKKHYGSEDAKDHSNKITATKTIISSNRRFRWMTMGRKEKETGHNEG
jgi:hypothetical protein